MARRSEFIKIKETLLLVVEGQTEQIYFNQMRSSLRLSNVSVEPKLSPKNDPLNIINTAIKEMDRADYQHVWCIFDLDTIDKNPVIYKEVILRARKKGIFIAESLPCFEIWFLLHYKYSTKQYYNSQQVISDLCMHISDYCKKQDWIRSKDLYSFLQDKISIARDNSKMLESNNLKNNVINGTSCSIHKIFDLIDRIK